MTAIEALSIDGLQAWAPRGIDIRTDVKYCFSYRVRRTLAKFGLPFEKATPLVHFPKALKRPRNNAGAAKF